LKGITKELSIKSSFHIIGDWIVRLSGDLTEKINPKIKNIVITIIIKTFLSERLSIMTNQKAFYLV
tara:strand:- start:561 stop:758 length:198 start_codon:yes stop_codon:yes gene_type:complete